MKPDDENEVLSNASFLHSSADVSKEYFYELSKEFGGLEGEEEEPVLMYAPQRKGAAMKSKLSRHLVNTVRSNPEIESFYRFVAENDLRHEALAILEETIKNKAASGKGVKKVLDEDIFHELESKAKMRAKASETQESEEEIAEAMAAAESKNDKDDLPGETKKKHSSNAGPKKSTAPKPKKKIMANPVKTAQKKAGKVIKKSKATAKKKKR